MAARGRHALVVLVVVGALPIADAYSRNVTKFLAHWRADREGPISIQGPHGVLASAAATSVTGARIAQADGHNANARQLHVDLGAHVKSSQPLATLAAKSRLMKKGFEAQRKRQSGMASSSGYHFWPLVGGGLLFVLAIVMLWLNEQRNARMDALVARGRKECVCVASSPVDELNHGRLVHVQGRARGTVATCDPRFQDAIVKNCIKLQSTIEVFQWVQTNRTWLDGKMKRSQPRFHADWTTTHQDSGKFKKPSPENPRPPVGLALGTATHVCPRVQLGDFVLTADMVAQLHRFQPAMSRLPEVLNSGSLVFVANKKDGYYYARPGVSASRMSSINRENQIGDLRVRFMCVPETDCTVTAVQCQLNGLDTFVPYRPIPRGCCFTDEQERNNLVAEGNRSMKDIRQDGMCCSGGVVTCLCCSCNMIAWCVSQEVVTEEISYLSDRLDPVDKPFQDVVPRSTCRVISFRLLGWLLMFWATRIILSNSAGLVDTSPWEQVYGRYGVLVLALTITLALAASIIAATYLFYRPLEAMKWMLVVGLICSSPFVLGVGSVHD